MKFSTKTVLSLLCVSLCSSLECFHGSDGFNARKVIDCHLPLIQIPTSSVGQYKLYPNACYLISGESGSTRGCGSAYREGCHMMFRETGNLLEAVEVCFCKSNHCNAAPSVVTSSGIVFIFISVCLSMGTNVMLL